MTEKTIREVTEELKERGNLTPEQLKIFEALAGIEQRLDAQEENKE